MDIIIEKRHAVARLYDASSLNGYNDRKKTRCSTSLQCINPMDIMIEKRRAAARLYDASNLNGDIDNSGAAVRL